MSERGKYIVIEGMDATGKSLQVNRLHKRLGDIGIRAIQIHEPDGYEGSKELGIPAVSMSSELRRLIKNGSLERDALTNVMLFTAARRENWQQAMEPALKMGVWVVSARNWLSTVAYQGYGEGLSVETIGKITGDFVGKRYAFPDMTMLLTLENEGERAQRIAGRGELENPDTFESRAADFQQRVAEGYLSYARVWDEGIPVIDASGTPEAVEAEVWRHVSPLTKT